MTIIYMPFDFFTSWNSTKRSGLALLHGWYAKLTRPLHWIIYGLGHMVFGKKSWTDLGERVLASGSHRHVFWNQLDPRGGGLVQV